MGKWYIYNSDDENCLIYQNKGKEYGVYEYADMTGLEELKEAHNADVAERDELQRKLNCILSELKDPNIGELSSSNPDPTTIGPITHACSVLYNRIKNIVEER